jgi:DNA-binding MarR family transcriptional regulator
MRVKMSYLPSIKWFLAELISNDQPELTNKQMCIFLYVYDTKKICTVKSLTEELKLSKDVVSRCISRLEELNFLSKRKDPKDRRVIIVEKTFAGLCFANTLVSSLDKAIEKYHAMLWHSPVSERSQLLKPLDGNILCTR